MNVHKLLYPLLVGIVITFGAITANLHKKNTSLEHYITTHKHLIAIGFKGINCKSLVTMYIDGRKVGTKPMTVCKYKPGVGA